MKMMVRMKEEEKEGDDENHRNMYRRKYRRYGTTGGIRDPPSCPQVGLLACVCQKHHKSASKLQLQRHIMTFSTAASPLDGRAG
ncbi:hypothetical protein E2C01_068929 [Portunus trituberculatus]|uniref:Uncharacterized protein n=1 Tax=Portunus trituberculatus TaxID=210409 RepID=A0A5B7HXV5_PORTR|nr:hypothetical protein [Portunus trituberculatus]